MPAGAIPGICRDRAIREFSDNVRTPARQPVMIRECNQGPGVVRVFGDFSLQFRLRIGELFHREQAIREPLGWTMEGTSPYHSSRWTIQRAGSTILARVQPSRRTDSNRSGSGKRVTILRGLRASAAQFLLS